MNQQQDATTDCITAEQLELIPMLVEGAEPDAYIVIPVAVLSRQVRLSAAATGRRYREKLHWGQFSMHLMRSLLQLGAVVDTKYLRDEDPAP